MSNNYPNKGLQVWAKAQAVEGTPLRDSNFTGQNALALFEPTYSVDNTSETMAYSGSDVDRKSQTFTTDRVLSIAGTTFLPGLFSVTGVPSITDFPLESLFAACGASITYSGTGVTAKVKACNDVKDLTKLTVMVSMISPEDTVHAKVYRAFDAYASVDLDIEVGKMTKLSWTFKGTTVDLATPPESFPEEINKISPSTSVQETKVFPTVLTNKILQAELLPVGVAPPTEFTGTVKNICLAKVSFKNLFAFDFQRELTSCNSGFSSEVTNSEFSFTVLEEDVAATIKPDTLVDFGGSLNQHFSFSLLLGYALGNKIYLHLSDIELTDTKNSQVGTKRAKDLTFKNCGTTTLWWSAS